MAESLRAKFGEHLSCAICLEYLRDPRVLPCLHSYCRECLEKLDMPRNILTCPECRDTVEVPRPPNVSFLPSNFFAKNLLATLLLTKDSDSGNITCENCHSDEQAETRCGPCALYLCHSCTELHRRYRKHHHLNTLGELRKSESSIIAQTIYCPKHKEEGMKLYCKTCQETICRDCTILDHRQHDYLLVQDIAEEKRSELLKLLKDVKQRKNEISRSLADFKQKREALNENNDSTVKRIEAYFGNMATLLLKKKEEFISQTRSSKDAKLKQLHIQQEDLEFMLASCESNIGFTEQAFQNGNDVQLLNLMTYISKSLENQKDKKFGVETSDIDTAGIVFEAKINEQDLVQRIAQNCFLRDINGDQQTRPTENARCSTENAPITSAEMAVMARLDRIVSQVQELGRRRNVDMPQDIRAAGNSNTEQQSTSTQAKTKNDMKIAVNAKSSEATAPSTPYKPVKTLFPPGSRVGNRTFRYGQHNWTIEIDHSCCQHYGRTADVEIGVINLLDGTTVTFNGFIKPRCCEHFELELDMPGETLSVQPSWSYDVTSFDVYAGRLSPFLNIDCKGCDVTITEQNFRWRFKEY